MQTLYHSPLRKQIAAGILAVSLLSLATPSIAQDIPEGSTLEDVLARQKVNQEQANFARNQLAQNAANQAAYERQMADYDRQLADVEAAKARIAADDAAARSAFEAETARVEAEAARIKSQHAAAMAQWEADVAACNAGNWSRCAGG